ncbi:DDE-type integrase/transposase/recombinase, partial [Xenorhabdus bovienii]|uniref:DDE-type integrase/transposase/recombinase n=1 Tax=Xenorhabdus bovienii TaxID=40576 RepID=UPI0023B33BF1
LLQQDFIPACSNTRWCGDITYIRTKAGWCYLAVVMVAVVMDLFSRRVVGIAISSSPDAERVCRALNNALETRHYAVRQWHSGYRHITLS